MVTSRPVSYTHLDVYKRQVPDLAYLVVGEGSMTERLWKLVSDLRLESTVLFTGGVSDDDVLEYYRTCDVYAMPNRTTVTGDTEGFGLVFLEAGACGKAVIGGKAGGVPDAIRDGETGFLVDGTSVDADVYKRQEVVAWRPRPFVKNAKGMLHRAPMFQGQLTRN